jgi:hypothetical protein
MEQIEPNLNIMTILQKSLSILVAAIVCASICPLQSNAQNLKAASSVDFQKFLPHLREFVTFYGKQEVIDPVIK